MGLTLAVGKALNFNPPPLNPPLPLPPPPPHPKGTDITPIVPALEKIWRDSKGQSLADFNFRWALVAFGGGGVWGDLMTHQTPSQLHQINRPTDPPIHVNPT